MAKVRAAGHTVTDVDVTATSTNEDDWDSYDSSVDLEEQTPDPLIFRLVGDRFVVTEVDAEQVRI